jgi:hypothetical protein
MKKLLLIMAAVAFALAIGKAKAQTYGPVESFYQANTELDFTHYAGRIVNPTYWLVDWTRWNEMKDRLVSNGFVQMGTSGWEGPNELGNGVPQKDLALAYARVIGADVVIYAVHDGDKYNYSAHSVGFYAKQHAPTGNTRPSNAQASAAMNRLQDALGKPRVKGGVWYVAATDTYNWIGPKFGKQMSEPASEFLGEVGPYLY